MNDSSHRRIGVRQLEFLVIGTAIGSGLFVGSGQALHDAGPSLLIAHALCAAAVYIVTRCLGEMALEHPTGRSSPCPGIHGRTSPRSSF